MWLNFRVFKQQYVEEFKTFARFPLFQILICRFSLFYPSFTIAFTITILKLYLDWHHNDR